ncbi:MAG: hypothetical protein EA349_01835 [Halomonadaceae bacterium]|nr:MAG: hypothetical protein EA349_01835 [Halomonadaceae bacterium]
MDLIREVEFTTYSPQKEPPAQLPVLDEYRSIRDQLHGRLCREVEELECRIRVLRASRSRHSQTIIRTYERMIQQKRRFMQQWGMGR